MNIAKRVKRLVLILSSAALVGLGHPGHTEDSVQVGQPKGLIWNRTGLPAVFPLQVKTRAGLDYVMTLYDSTSGDAAIAAYITGGAFFKLLVPPGTYDLHFAGGRKWISEEALFGTGGDTAVFVLDQPLTFTVRDFRTKVGHLVDLVAADPETGTGTVVTQSVICQGVQMTSAPRLQPLFDDVAASRLRIPDEGDLMRLPSRFSEEKLRDSGAFPVFPTRYAPYFSHPEFEVRADRC